MRISDWSSDVCSSDLLGLQVHAKAEAGLVGRVVRRHVGAPVDVALLQAQAFDGAIADVANTVLLPGRQQCLVDVRREFGRDVQFPAQLADVADADRQHRSEEHTSELQLLKRLSYAALCFK